MMNSKNILLKYKKTFIALLLIVLTFVVGELIMVGVKGADPGSFLSVNQVLITIKLATFISLFGLCEMIVISTGGDMDLSVGWIATLAAIFSTRIMDGKNQNLLIAILIAIGVGAAFGLLNGLLVSYAKLPSLVVTLAMGNIIQGLINAYTTGIHISGEPSPIVKKLAAKYTGIVPNIVTILLILCIIVIIIIYKTKIGVKLLSIGSNPNTAYLSGLNIKLIRMIAFIASGAIAGIIGILLVGNAGTAYKDMGSNYLMPGIVAVVVGGVSVKGGEGNYFAVILGAIVLQTLTNLFVSLGWGDAGKWTGYGLILILMLITYVRNKRSR